MQSLVADDVLDANVGFVRLRQVGELPGSGRQRAIVVNARNASFAGIVKSCAIQVVASAGG
ncbi:MAG: hypothetical protein ABI552_00145 [Casimicrobiaceae bacterium]